MNAYDEPRPELADLLSALVDGSITPQEHQDLGNLLQGDATARADFLDYMRIHSSLKWDALDLIEPHADAVSEDSVPIVAPLPLGWLSQSWPTRLLLLIVVLMLPATLMTFATWAGFFRADRTEVALVPPSPPPQQPVYVGVLRDVEQPVWEDRTIPTTSGELVLSGSLHLLSGRVEIALFGGASLTLTGPCLLELESSTSGFLHEGDVLVSVGDDDVQFTLNTPSGELVHIGTQFGVSVNATGETDMYVYEGVVQVNTVGKNQPTASVRLVRRGDAMSLDPSGRVEAIASRQLESFRTSITSLDGPRRFQPRSVTVNEFGYKVRYVKATSTPIDSLAAAADLLAGRITATEDVTVRGVDRIDFRDHPDNPSYADIFTGDRPFPGDDGGSEENDDRFVIRATATVVVHDAWQYSFMVNVDDGARLRIDGKDVIVDDGIHPPQVSIGTVVLTAGSHTLELIAYENTAFARVELGIAPGETRRIEDFSLLAVPMQRSKRDRE